MPKTTKIAPTAEEILETATAAAKELIAAAAVLAKEVITIAATTSEKLQDDIKSMLVTNARNFDEHLKKFDEHLKSDTKIFEELKDWIMGQNPDIPGIAGRVDRIEQRELASIKKDENKQKQLLALWTIVAGGIVTILIKLLGNL